MQKHLSRRNALVLSSLGLTALATAGLRGRSVSAAGRALSATTHSSGSAMDRAALCVLSPEQTQGPYFIPAEKVRSNITERRSGTPLKLQLTVVDAGLCTPIKGAVVDIWHCNAGGIYSGFESASTGGPGGSPGPTDKDTFLRGIQYTDVHGLVQFQTIYPGWYRGRTVHIHVMVHVGGNIVHTGQLYFADSLTDSVYQKSPYKARAAARDTRNNTDDIYGSGGLQSTLAMKHGSTGGYTGSISLGVRTA